MTSAEEVPSITCSIGARQAEPRARKERLVHVFSESAFQQATLTGPYFGPQACQWAHM